MRGDIASTISFQPYRSNRLEHMLTAINVIEERVGDMTLEDLSSDKVLFAGIVYYTMIIGEAAYKLSPEFVDTFKEVNWQEIADMRHHLVHGYYQVNSRIIWSVIHNDLEPLKRKVSSILENTDWLKWEATYTK